MSHKHEELQIICADGEKIERSLAEHDQQQSNLFGLLNSTKESRQAVALAAINSVLDGIVNPIDAHVALKALQDTIALVLESKEYRAAIVEEASKYEKTGFEKHNAKVQVREVWVKYDFTQTGDTLLFELQETSDKIGEAIKKRQNFLKAIPSTGVADAETGEMIYPPSKSSTTSVVVTLK